MTLAMAICSDEGGIFIVKYKRQKNCYYWRCELLQRLDIVGVFPWFEGAMRGIGVNPD
jgi:hypothetical protein